jgi:hypothetical protein
MEIELFPRIHLKVRQGISLSTAHCWLRGKGFRYILHKKGLYFDGHDWLDVLAYWQNEFLPTMKILESSLVQYVVGDVDKEIPPPNFVEHQLVLCAHDKSTSQVVMCTAQLQAVGQAKPGPIRPSQAGPKSRLDHGFGLAWDPGKPKPSAQATAFEWFFGTTRKCLMNKL